MAARPLPAGTRVEKINSHPRHGHLRHRDGALGTVLAAVADGYLVEWDDAPGAACFTSGTMLRKVAGPRKKKK